MAQVRRSHTATYQRTDQRWNGIKPLRTPIEVAQILGISRKQVLSIEQKIFRKIRNALPPARNRIEAARSLEVSHALYL